MRLEVHNYNHPDASTRLLLLKILRGVEKNMSKLDELNVSVDGLASDFAGLKADVEAFLTGVISQADLQAALDKINAVDADAKALDAEVKPAPAPEPAPAPVEEPAA
jgi:hypothetical protein